MKNATIKMTYHEIRNGFVLAKHWYLRRNQRGQFQLVGQVVTETVRSAKTGQYVSATQIININYFNH